MTRYTTTTVAHAWRYHGEDIKGADFATYFGVGKNFYQGVDGNGSRYVYCVNHDGSEPMCWEGDWLVYLEAADKFLAFTDEDFRTQFTIDEPETRQPWKEEIQSGDVTIRLSVYPTDNEPCSFLALERSDTDGKMRIVAAQMSKRLWCQLRDGASDALEIINQ
jgi:hypothetical protein